MTDTTALARLAQVSRAWISWLDVERGLLPSTILGYRREMRQLYQEHGTRVAAADLMRLADGKDAEGIAIADGKAKAE